MRLCAHASACQSAAKAKAYTLSSPDGNITVNVSLADTLSYSVSDNGRPVSEKVNAALATSKGMLGVNPKVRHVSRKKVRDTFRPVVPLKYSTVADSYNSMTLDFKDGYAVELRAYDDGVAHRFITSLPGEIEVTDEIYAVTVNPGATAHLQQPSGFKTSYEDAYSHKPISEWNASDRMSTLPVLLQDADDRYILISESDLTDYPAMFLKGDGNGRFHSIFPKVPVKFGEDGDRSVKILEEAPYIALTGGTRSFPWRFMAIGDGKDIAGQTMSARLAQRNSLTDTSWIKPGTASWEWWNGATPMATMWNLSRVST